MKKIILIILLFSLKVSAQVTLETIFETPDSQINLYIVSQGFTSGSMSQFDSFTGNPNNPASGGFLNVLFATEPYHTYQAHFRVILVRDPAAVENFPRAYNQFNPPSLCNSTLADVDGSESPETFYARMDQLVEDHIPNYDNDHSYVIAIFNNKYYTGGGGRYTFATTFCPFYYEYMQHVLVHEFSHSFGLLGDEYFSNAASVGLDAFPIFTDRNITKATVRENVPWNYLVSPSTPIPTCNSTTSCTETAIGTYLGANYVSTEWYRPVPNCKMRSVTQPLCPVCQGIVTEKIKEHFCKPSVTISEDFLSRHQAVIHYRKSTDYLTASSAIGNKIHVDYRAQSAIDLTPGFDSRTGSVFGANILGCWDLDVRNPYRIKQDNTVFTCHLRPGETDGPGLIVAGTRPLQLTLYPNPASGIVNISLENGILSTINIVGIDGKVVYEKTLYSSSEEINIADFSNGIYLVRATAADGRVHAVKLVKD